MSVEIIRAGFPVIRKNLSSELERVAVEASGSAGQTVIKMSVPIRGTHCYWTPDLRLPSQKLHWTISLLSSAVKDFPYLAFFSLEGRNICSLAPDSLTDDTEITAKMNQETGCYDVTITVAGPERGPAFTLTVDRRPLPWMECLADWRGSLNVPVPEFPGGAWEPVFCTWYAAHASVTQDWIERCAAFASGLGCGTLIVDDGWCFDTMKRVSPETLPTWYDMIGDWEVSKAKFPDFRGHVEKVRSMGLKYLLWVSPALIGVKSKILRELGPGAVSEKPFEGARTLNPADKHAATLITEKLAGLVGRLGLDGLKIDFLDYFKPDMSRPSGRAALALVSELSEKIRQSVPDALIEFRQSYATPGMTPHATQFRAGDVPFDFLDNFNRLCQIRVSMGDGVPVHSDPVFWRPDESLVNVSRHMIASLAGVPMLSMDPALMSADSKAVVKHWMDFYRAHKKTLAFGRWQISYNLSNVSFAAAVTAEESVIILNDARALDEALSLVSGDAHILNLSGAELSVNDAEIFSVTGEKGSANQLARGGRALTRR